MSFELQEKGFVLSIATEDARNAATRRTSTATARGSLRPLLTRTVRYAPFSLDTSMVSRPLSHQYRFPPTQSTARPSGLLSDSFSLSQVQLIGIQRPLGQAKKGVGHFVFPLPGTVTESDDAHWLLRYVGSEHLHVSSCVFVGPQHGPPHPVRPEDVVAVHGQAKRDKGSGVVIARHADHGVPVNGAPAALIHSVAGDGGGGVAGPVQHIPAPVKCVSQEIRSSEARVRLIVDSLSKGLIEMSYGVAACSEVTGNHTTRGI
ncbi:hypothetical protein EYF80_008394 [Liparis tanakae]|uniref:Uncharacterized protein n=1 Tax=Liparis tanakae TaxID=230148 RepID=A0A4Z2IUV0_9TELE|nr:hypothetical protein EYF80_008394 [Liparis tanakae]